MKDQKKKKAHLKAIRDNLECVMANDTLLFEHKVAIHNAMALLGHRKALKLLPRGPLRPLLGGFTA